MSIAEPASSLYECFKLVDIFLRAIEVLFFSLFHILKNVSYLLFVIANIAIIIEIC